MPRPRKHSPDDAATPTREVVGLRIVGGTFRGRKLAYSGDPLTRPMKDRVREAIFNLLGPSVRGSWAIDLFAGTGALGLEALSRGAAAATFLERHFPTAQTIRDNIATLGVCDVCDVLPANTLIWIRQPATRQRLDQAAAAGRPWTVFCAPPYELYVSQEAEMLALLETLLNLAPSGSQFMVEADERFDVAKLPRAASWLRRTSPPAVTS